MSDIFDPSRTRAENLSSLVQPVIFALGTAGMTGGAIAALTLLTSHTLSVANPRKAC